MLRFSRNVYLYVFVVVYAAYTLIVMSLAGIFLGIVWSRTKNIYLIMALHAMVDLLPNIGDFMHDWHIQ